MLNKEEFKIIYVAPMKALAAEMTEGFSKRLRPLGIQVKELTGDMQLTRQELTDTQVIVTTPEKWDVITRKSTDVALTQIVRLLIIDEVHLLNEGRRILFVFFVFVFFFLLLVNVILLYRFVYLFISRSWSGH